MKKVLVTAILAVSMLFAGCGCGSTAENTAAGTEAVEATETEEINETEMPENRETTEMAESEMAENTEVTEIEETEVVEETTEAGTETATVEEKASEYTFTELSTTKYAKSSVNVRNLPCKDGEKLGSLSTNQEVKVTGRCNETNWYRIEYNGSTAYVSNNYLVDEKVVIQTAPTDNSTPAGTADSSSGDASENAQESYYAPAPEAQPENTPVQDNNGSADNGSSNTSSEMTQEQIDDIKQEFADNPDVTVDDDGTLNIGGLGTGTPTTDGYGEGVTITIQPVQ